MTLITYLSRVHFADGVLEVALSSELELNNLSRPLLVAEQNAVNSEFSERVTAGLPFWCHFNFHEISANTPSHVRIAELRQCIVDTNSDVVIAFGSSLALTIADACCRGLESEKLEHGIKTISASPKFFAIPGVDGLPNMSMRREDGVRATITGDGIQPTAVILDPTLIVGESVQRTASAIADTLARCLSAHFSDAYNPPADGIAVEGVKRILRNLSSLLCEDSLDMRRELMAASLNGTLAMQKEIGISHELCRIFLRDPPAPINKGALMRLLILLEVDLLEQHWTQHRRSEVTDGLGIPTGTGLRDWLSSILEDLPLPDSLHLLGITSNCITQAAEELVSSRDVTHSARDLGDMMHGIRLERGNLLPTP